MEISIRKFERAMTNGQSMNELSIPHLLLHERSLEACVGSPETETSSSKHFCEKTENVYASNAACCGFLFLEVTQQLNILKGYIIWNMGICLSFLNIYFIKHKWPKTFLYSWTVDEYVTQTQKP